MKHLDNEAKIRMVQINQNRWQLETRHGYVLQSFIFVDNPNAAEEYVKNYLSSYSCWTYEVVPLNKKESKK